MTSKTQAQSLLAAERRHRNKTLEEQTTQWQTTLDLVIQGVEELRHQFQQRLTATRAKLIEKWQEWCEEDALPAVMDEHTRRWQCCRILRLTQRFCLQETYLMTRFMSTSIQTCLQNSVPNWKRRRKGDGVRGGFKRLLLKSRAGRSP